ncbi:MAG: hypothetical protein JXB13_08975 [Phycisphaerae bacterium]|nr:hypothetical protein [Phycisphaerae bacterium]
MKTAEYACVRLAAVSALAATALPLSYGQAAAAPHGLASAEPPARQMVLDAGWRHRLRADVDDGATFNVDSFNIAMGMTRRLTERLKLDVHGGYSVDSYDFSDGDTFGGMPWEDVNCFQARFLARYRHEDRWEFLGGPVLVGHSEQDAKEDSMEGGALAGVLYSCSPVRTAGIAVVALSRLEGDTLVMPVPIIQWSLNDDWVVRTRASSIGSVFELGLQAESCLGIGMEAERTLTPRWACAAGAQFHSRRFRLDDSGVQPDGIGEDTGTHVYLQASWRSGRASAVEVFAGVQTQGELTIRDEDGDKVAREDYDPAGVLGMRAMLRF